MKVRFLRTSTWIVRARPVASACLISLVDFFTKVIFLRSPVAVPWLVLRWLSKACLSASETASFSDFLLTPAALSCSNKTLVGLFSSAANSATVLLVIGCYLRLGLRCFTMFAASRHW